jgi:hypothetical protein
MQIPKNKKATYMPNHGCRIGIVSIAFTYFLAAHQFIGQQQYRRSSLARCLHIPIRRMLPDLSDTAIPALILHFRPIREIHSKEQLT